MPLPLPITTLAPLVLRVTDFVVARTYLRTSRDRTPSPVGFLTLEAGIGIRGDCHADARSPRQVLLTASGAYERLALKDNSLRENILIDIPRLDWPSGTAITIGTAMLRVMFRCEPCAKLNQKRANLSRDVGSDRGLLARVVHSGDVAAGNGVRVTVGAFAQLSNDWRERVRDVVRNMSNNSWAAYSELAGLAGVHVSYCRAFPRVLSDLPGISTASPGKVLRLRRGRTKPEHFDGNPHFAAEQLLLRELVNA